MKLAVITSVEAVRKETGELYTLLDPCAGTIPSKRAMSNKYAEIGGFKHGETFLVKWEELERNEYGRNFRFTKLKTLGALEIIALVEKLGDGKIFDINESTEEESAPPVKDHSKSPLGV